jgi:hypothetical protein
LYRWQCTTIDFLLCHHQQQWRGTPVLGLVLLTHLHAHSLPIHPQVAAAQLAEGGSRGALQVPRQLKPHHPETWRVSVWQASGCCVASAAAASEVPSVPPRQRHSTKFD